MASGPPPLLAPAACELAVASYNVHRCIGADGRHDPARIAEVLRELDADVIGLQEVASRFGGDGAIDQLAYLARALGYQPVTGPTLAQGGGHCGNALLTRCPILGVERIDLSRGGREPRGAIDVELAVGADVVRVVVTHLGLRWTDRRAQVRRLLAALGDDRAGFVVVLGDINEWLPRGGCLGRLHARLGHAPAVRTFPARRPLLALDRVWVQPRAGLTELRAHATPLARAASDHLPVRGTIGWLTAAASVA
jgi:endonuclease/exonuclease/phosphatase family metal-dependent hydrolase